MRLLLAVASALVTALVVAPGAGAAALTAFQSPTRNIGCILDARSARCDIAEHDWRSPAKPSGCDLDYGSGLAISRSGTRGGFVCAGDTALHAGSVLAYGRSVRRGQIRCTSRQSGIRCTNARGHGFRLSRGSYQRF